MLVPVTIYLALLEVHSGKLINHLGLDSEDRHQLHYSVNSSNRIFKLQHRLQCLEPRRVLELHLKWERL